MSQRAIRNSGQGLDNVNIQLLSFLCNFVTKSVCPTPIKMPLRVLWSMGLTEGAVQRVDMSLRTNKLPCVLASVIGVPCNEPLPRAVFCVPVKVLHVGSQGFNGTPGGFKQTERDPLLFSTVQEAAGSPPRSALPARPAGQQQALSHVHTHTHMHTHTYTHTHTHGYTHIHAYTHSRVHTRIHKHVYTHMDTHTCTHTRTYMYTHLCVYCSHTCIHTPAHSHTCMSQVVERLGNWDSNLKGVSSIPGCAK